MKQKDNAAKKNPAPFTEVAGAGDEITPEAFREETDELLRQKIASHSRGRSEKTPDDKSHAKNASKPSEE